MGCYSLCLGLMAKEFKQRTEWMMQDSLEPGICVLDDKLGLGKTQKKMAKYLLISKALL